MSINNNRKDQCLVRMICSLGQNDATSSVFWYVEYRGKVHEIFAYAMRDTTCARTLALEIKPQDVCMNCI